MSNDHRKGQTNLNDQEIYNLCLYNKMVFGTWDMITDKEYARER